MAIDSQFLDELRARVKPADVIGRCTRLTRKGREFLGLCPFHNEKTPSFYVYDDHYHCFGCGAHGSVIDFVMQTEGLEFREAVEKLAAEVGLDLPAETPEARRRAERQKTLIDVMEAACRWYERQLRLPEGRAAQDYLRRRGLNETDWDRFRLGFAPDRRGALKAALERDGIAESLLLEAGLMKRPDDGRPPFDYFRDRVLFAITDRRGRVIAFGGRILGDGEPKYLNSPETPLFHKGRTLYGLAHARPAARGSGRVIVAEGYMDVIALHRAGFEDAVAPLGTALTEDQLRELWRLAPEPVLCLDGDAAGRKAAARVAERALPLLKPGFSLRLAPLPAGEDPDSLIRREGAGAMREVLDGAVPLSEALWAQVMGGARIDSPERRAALWKTLKDRVFAIQDPTLRRGFLETYEARFWKRRDGGPGSAPTARAADPEARRRFDAQLREQRIQIGLLLARPDFFPQVDEDFGRMSLKNRDDDAVRHAIVEKLGRFPSTGREDLEASLRAAGHAPAIDQILELVEIKSLVRNGLADPGRFSDRKLLERWRASRRAIELLAIRDDLGPLPDDGSGDDELRRRLDLTRTLLADEPTTSDPVTRPDIDDAEIDALTRRFLADLPKHKG